MNAGASLDCLFFSLQIPPLFFRPQTAADRLHPVHALVGYRRFPYANPGNFVYRDIPRADAFCLRIVVLVRAKGRRAIGLQLLSGGIFWMFTDA